jgi:hypothetical protein
MELAGQLEPTKPWIPRLVAHIREGKLGKVPLIEAGRDPRREWVEALRKAIAGESLDQLHDKLLLSEEDVRQCFEGGDFCADFGPRLAEAFVSWARHEVGDRDEPPYFQGLARQGWAPSKQHGTVTLIQAYCLFFREHLKRNAHLFRILVTDMLNDIRSVGRIPGDAAASAFAVDLDQFERWLEPQLGALIQLLHRVSYQLDALERGQRELADKQGEILVALTTLRIEVERDNPRAQSALDDLSTFVDRFDQAFRELRRDLFGLPLIRPGVPRRPERDGGDLWMLQAKYRALALVGRERELGDLWQWLHGLAPISVRLLVGGAGAGKTRLSFELIWRLILEMDDAWDAGRVNDTDLRKFDDHRFWQDWRWDKPTLIVVDYARSVHGPLTDMLKALSLKVNAGLPPLRLLLLERTQGATEDWVNQLLEIESSEGGRPVRALFDPPKPVPMDALDESTLRRELLARALLLVAEFRGGQTLALPSPGERAEFDKELSEPRWADPLYLSMAALVAHDAKDLLAGLRCTRPDLAFALAKRELARVERFARDPREDQRHLLRQLAGCIALERGFTPVELLGAVSEELTALQRTWPGGAGDLAKQLATALPDGSGGAADIEPDFIGEAVVLEAFDARSPSDMPSDRVMARLAPWCDAVARCAGRNPFSVSFTLIHMFQNFGHVADRGPALLAAVDHLLKRGLFDETSPLLLALDAVMPDQTVGLRSHAAEVSRALYERLSIAVKNGREDLKPETARLAANLGSRLSALGRRAEALAPAQDAVDLFRALARQRPGAFRPALAMSLNNLANRLSELGRRPDALPPAQEAADLHRALARQNPDAFQPALALSLNNLANRLSELGRRREALPLTQEAADLHRALARQNPDAFQPAFATSLNNLANRFSELGQYADALPLAQESVEVRRALARQNPDAFQPDLATSLLNLATHLSALGRRADALSIAQETVALYRALARRNPDAFRPDLALSLNNLANRLSAVGRRADALPPAQETVDLYRALARRNPDAFQPDLAMSLNNLANRLSAVGRRADALPLAQEAADLRRALAHQNPDAFQPDLAMSLHNLATHLSALGRHADALSLAQEAVDLYRSLARRNPGAFQPDLAMSLNNLASHLSDLGRRDDSLPPAEEAVDLYRSLARRNPDAVQPELARSLGTLSRIQSEMERHDEATDTLSEGIESLRSQFARFPEAFAPLMRFLVRSYLEASLIARRKPDMTLLTPVMQVLVQLGRAES